jgi:hypothetical protein
MAFNVNEIRQNMIGDGARPSLFEVSMINPISRVGDETLRYMVRAAQIPASTLGVIEIPYFGRRIKVAGSRSFDNWTVTVMNDENFAVRRAMEAWSSAINSNQSNLRSVPSYRTTADVIQFGKDGSEIRRYQFVNIFPVAISTIDLSWDSGDQIEEYTVDFSFDYWTVADDEIIQ